MGGIWGWLAPADADAAAVEADAHHLRDLYGSGAEAWCAAALAALPAGDVRRESIQKIVRSLRGVPVADLSEAGAWADRRSQRLEPRPVGRL
jgi:hypothetical protein